MERSWRSEGVTEWRVWPDAERRLYGQAEQGAGVPGEDVADFGPLVGLKQTAVRRVLNTITQVNQAAH